MVSWLPHVLVPSLVALAFFRHLPRKTVMLLAVVAWIPDLDYFSPGEHRELSHNLWIPLAFFAALWILWHRRGKAMDLWTFCGQRGAPVILFLCGYYWASHVLLDVFAGGVVLFWPVLDYNFQMFYEININLQTGEVFPEGDASVEPGGAPEVSDNYPWLYYDHTAVLAFLGLVGVVAAIRAGLRRLRASRMLDLTDKRRIQ